MSQFRRLITLQDTTDPAPINSLGDYFKDRAKNVGLWYVTSFCLSYHMD